MILNSLELEYFRKHKTLKVDFTEGLNLIVGDNYTGKTTITHAILFAFGGVRALPFSADRVATRGSGKRKRFKSSPIKTPIMCDTAVLFLAITSSPLVNVAFLTVLSSV